LKKQAHSIRGEKVKGIKGLDYQEIVTPLFHTNLRFESEFASEWQSSITGIANNKRIKQPSIRL
jgi:hypothetical protein